MLSARRPTRGDVVRARAGGSCGVQTPGANGGVKITTNDAVRRARFQSRVVPLDRGRVPEVHDAPHRPEPVEVARVRPAHGPREVEVLAPATEVGRVDERAADGAGMSGERAHRRREAGARVRIGCVERRGADFEEVVARGREGERGEARDVARVAARLHGSAPEDARVARGPRGDRFSPRRAPLLPLADVRKVRIRHQDAPGREARLLGDREARRGQLLASLARRAGVPRGDDVRQRRAREDRQERREQVVRLVLLRVAVVVEHVEGVLEDDERVRARREDGGDAGRRGRRARRPRRARGNAPVQLSFDSLPRLRRGEGRAVERRELGLGRPGARAVREKYQHKEAAGHSTAFGYHSLRYHGACTCWYVGIP